MINALPREWAKQADRAPHPFLDRLADFLISLGSKLDPTENLSEIREVIDLLKLMGAKQPAKTLMDKYL